MTKNEKAASNLLSHGVETSIHKNKLHVNVNLIPLELSQFEVNFRASLYDIHQENN